MEKIKCLVLDVDLTFCELIASFIEEHPQFELIGKFTEPEKAKQFIMRNPVPLIFIDMKLPGITGIDFLRSLSYKPYAVFITSFPEHALESYDVNTIDYKLKPITEENFFAVLNKTVEKIGNKMNITANRNEAVPPKIHDEFFFIQTKNTYVKIFYNHILYVKAMENFVQMVVSNKEETINPHINLKQLESILPADFFLRVHKSYIVNINHVSGIGKKGLLIANEVIPTGNFNKEYIVNRIVKNTLVKRA